MAGVRWRGLLLEALAAGSRVIVTDLVADHLGREPTRAELSAARRAAHRLSDAGLARVGRVRDGSVTDAGDRWWLALLPADEVGSELAVGEQATPTFDRVRPELVEPEPEPGSDPVPPVDGEQISGDESTVERPTPRRGGPRSHVQLARGVARTLDGASRAALLLEVDRIDPAVAGVVAADLRGSLRTLGRLTAQLGRRGGEVG